MTNEPTRRRAQQDLEQFVKYAETADPWDIAAVWLYMDLGKAPEAWEIQALVDAWKRRQEGET